MAKGRRLTTSRSERFLGSYSNGHSQGDSVTDETELGEEDVWSMVDNVDRDNQSVNNSQSDFSPRAGAESNGNGNLDMRGHRRRIPRDDRNVGGLSLAFEDSSSTTPRIVHQFRGHDGVAATASPRGHHMATSAPVNVPDWSKIYRVDLLESIHDSDDGLDEGKSEMVPPHEYLAREYARSKKSGGASVFEGVGRTLKGRDMRRVRDAVWSQTGFDG
ncbi:uncharacterized protein LOC111280961 [Durio zibethinus]|uniref:Uncharacterized protein LOC111280961 n=1 Tax=Durio zibethinus TaxID=66656 RepID=A0A6P5X9G8_DURZI|nr:uncharacterized protein LOC111280961 [Durio zibethinus]XP_022724253.1 uncharacterized protein LOC111280961 [Durio zibethinus]